MIETTTPATTAEPGATGEGTESGWERRLRLVGAVRQVALLPVVVVLVVVGTAVSPAFLTASNFANIGQQISALGVVVVAESLVLLCGGIDLSLQSIYGLAAMVGAWLIVPAAAHGAGITLDPVLGLLGALVVGAAVGLFNGLLIVKGRINGFIFTLAMLILLAGVQTGMVSGQTLYALPSLYTDIGSSYVGSVPLSLIVTAAIFAVAGLFLRYHRAGRAIYAIGGNAAAARAAGIKVDRVRVAVYVAAGVLTALGGLMEAGRVAAVTSSQGNNLIFTVFAAAVIGGISLQGGRGTMVGAATGVLLLGVVQNVLTLGQVPSYWIDAVDGVVILIALGASRVIGGEQQRD